MKKLLVLGLLCGSAVSMQKPPAQAMVLDQKLQNKLVEAVTDKKKDEVVRLLKFRPRVSVNAVDTLGDRPLERAVYNKNADIAELLLEHGANPNQRITGGMTPGQTLLMHAAAMSDAPMVELLLSYGADVNATYSDTMNRGGMARKAIDFVTKNDESARKIRNVLTQHNKMKLP